MANKTVAAVVKLIDEFSDPSRTVARQSKNLEKRIGNLGSVFENAGQFLEGAGESLTKSVSVPMAAAGTAAIKFASESQDAYKQFAAATGTATENLGKYQDMINNVYKDNFGESIGDVADAMAKVDQNMSYLDDSALQRCTEYAYTLADTFDVDIGESTRAADSLIKNFGVSAREAFNLMAQGAQNGLDFSGELFDNVDEYSVQFQKLGLDAEDMFSIFANGAENGAFNLDKIGDAVKEFSIRAIDGSDTTKQGFEAIGMNADKMAKRFAAGGQDAKAAFNEVIQGLDRMDDPVAQSAAGVNLFGTMWEDLGPQVITTLSTTNGAIDKTKETMEELVNTRYDTLTGALGGLWRTIQVDVLQPVGTMLIPYVEQGITVIDSLVDHWNELDPVTQKTIVKFAAVAAATGPVLLGAGKVSSGIGGMITNFGKISGAMNNLIHGKTGFKAFGTVMTGPAGIAIVAIAAGALLIYKNWDRISSLLEKTATRFESFWNTVQPQLQPFLGLCTEIGSYLESGFIKAVQFVFSEGSDVIVIFFEGASQYIDGFLGVLEGVTTFMNGVFTGNWEKAWKGLRDIVSNSFGMLGALVKTPMNAVISIVNGAISRVNSIHFTVPEWVPGIGGKGWKGLDVPQIPTLAKGTDNWQGGIVQISEKGGEIVDLPRGTRVYPHDESVRMARSENKGTVITIAKLADSIIVREEADIDRIAERIVKKIKETNDNLPQTAVA